MEYLRFDKQVAKLQILPFLNYVEVYHPKGSPPSLTNGPLLDINRAMEPLCMALKMT